MPDQQQRRLSEIMTEACAPLVADKERLDWLSTPENLEELYFWMQTFGKDWKESLREAIDKAILTGTGEK